MMKILIGTPIHEVKDYCMEQWLQNVSKIKYPAHLLLVDNSPGLGYVKKVKGYLAKYGIRNYHIKHIELPQEQKIFERVARSREIIRQEVLVQNYDAWFSWECDQIIPADALDILVKIINTGDFMMVNHNNWTRQTLNSPNFDFGVALIKREALEKHGFLLEFGTDPEMPDSWEPGEDWFRKRVLRGGGNYAEVDGLIKPVYHLNK